MPTKQRSPTLKELWRLKEEKKMNIVRNQAGRVMGVGDWANGFTAVQMPMMTLDQEVQKNGLCPVVNRMRRQ